MFAAKEGDEQQVAQLLDDGANVNKKSQYGWTALKTQNEVRSCLLPISTI